MFPRKPGRVLSKQIPPSLFMEKHDGAFRLPSFDFEERGPRDPAFDVESLKRIRYSNDSLRTLLLGDNNQDGDSEDSGENHDENVVHEPSLQLSDGREYGRDVTN